MKINPCLTYATVCSGIECMSAACVDLPMKPVFFSEIEPFPCAVLKSHFPNVPNLGDMSKIEVTNDGKEITNGTVRIVLDRNLDIFAGGTPCQDVSVAGKRSGMQEGSGTRSSLAFEFVRLVRELKPRYVLWENVAGVLSDKSFPEFLTALANCGYGVAYRTLDAQWVRVADCYHEDGGVVRMERAIPQRRRRVWVVGCAGGDVTKAAQILFEQKGVTGDNPPRRRTGQEIAAASRGRYRVHGGMVGEKRKTWWNGDDISATLTTGGAYKFTPDCGRFDAVVECFENNTLKSGDICRTLTGDHNDRVTDTGASIVLHQPTNDAHEDEGTTPGYKRGVISTNSNGGDVMPTLDCKGQSASGPGAQEDKRSGYIIQKRCFGINPVASGVMLDSQPQREVSMTLRMSPGEENGIIQMSQMRYIVRRPTPTECERLMGLPDGWTIPRNLEVTDALVVEFQRVHDTYDAIMYEYAMASYRRSHREGEPPPNPPKPKSAAWVRKWIEKIANPDTCPDAPRYKGGGNGWATNQPRWILIRLLTKEEVEWR